MKSWAQVTLVPTNALKVSSSPRVLIVWSSSSCSPGSCQRVRLRQPDSASGTRMEPGTWRV